MSKDNTPLNFYEHEIPLKFIAIYADGSGCELFWEVTGGFRNRDIEGLSSDWFTDAGYLWFIKLPDNFEIFQTDKVST